MKKLFLLLLVLFLVPTVPVKADTKKDLELKNKLIKLFKKEIDKSEHTKIIFHYTDEHYAEIKIDDKINAYASLKSHELTSIRVPVDYKVDKKLVKGMEKIEDDDADVYIRDTEKPITGFAKPDKHLIEALFKNIKVPLVQKKSIHNKLLKQTTDYFFGFNIYQNVEVPYFSAFDRYDRLIFNITPTREKVVNIVFLLGEQKNIKKLAKLLFNKDITKARKIESDYVTFYSYKAQDIIVAKKFRGYEVAFIDRKDADVKQN